MSASQFLKRAGAFLKARFAPRGARLSFAGSGEDLIMSDILKKLGVKSVFYLDVGAHDPVFGNNTYHFYRNGGRGILVEPNTAMRKRIEKKRPRDTFLNIGVAAKDGEADFYTFPQSTRSTFSKVEAEAWEKQSGQKVTMIKVSVLTLDSIIERYAGKKVPDLISLDTEGFEQEILASFSWRYRPKLFCLETTASSGQETGELTSLMTAHGYHLVGKTRINSIFVDSEAFKSF
jgi:FkbM family methyltransferase